MRKIIIETFIESAKAVNREITQRDLDYLSEWIDLDGSKNFIPGIFRGRTDLTEVFVTRCFQQRILPDYLFGPILKYFVYNHAGGSYYVHDTDPLLFQMLDYAGFENLNEKHNRNFIQQQPDVITVYRGGYQGPPDLFWSMDIDTAKKYLRKGIQRYLWEAQVKKSGIYICISGLQEVIFSPTALIHKKIIGTLNQDGVYCPVIPDAEIADL